MPSTHCLQCLATAMVAAALAPGCGGNGGGTDPTTHCLTAESVTVSCDDPRAVEMAQDGDTKPGDTPDMAKPAEQPDMGEQVADPCEPFQGFDTSDRFCSLDDGPEVVCMFSLMTVTSQGKTICALSCKNGFTCRMQDDMMRESFTCHTVTNGWPASCRPKN